MASEREEQLAYSEQMATMLDEDKRRQKAAKILAVLRHALGRDDLAGLRAVDVGLLGRVHRRRARRRPGPPRTGSTSTSRGWRRARARFGERVDFHCAPGRRHAVRRRQRRRRGAQPHLRARRRPRRRRCARSTGCCAPDGVLYLGLGQPARRGRAALPAAVPVLAAARPAGRPLRARRSAGPTTTTSGSAPGRACAGCSPASTSGTTRCRCSPTRSAFAGGDVVPGAVARVPARVLRRLLPLVPTYVWVGFRTPRVPAGPPLATGPRRV